MTRHNLNALARGVLPTVLVAAWLCLWTAEASAQVEPAVLSGVEFLKSRAAGQQAGESAMIALAMIKAEVPESDPALKACLDRIKARITSSGFVPQRSGGHDLYEAGVIAMALSNSESSDSKALLTSIASYIVSKQKPNGSWDYVQRSGGDCSISQYAILGLWEAENGGVAVDPSIWDRAALFFMGSQRSDGSWNYHPDSPETEANNAPTISMTAAGVGSLLICRNQLDSLRQSRKGINPALTPLVEEGASVKFQSKSSISRIDESIRRGLSWIGSRFSARKSIILGQSAYYGLYGIERIGALSDRQTLGRIDWFEQGKSYINSSQQQNGSWSDGPFPEVANTAWAILFLTRSTSKSLKRVAIRKLGAGTLLGGRGLPKDLTSLTVAGGRVVSRPMSGAVEGMLAVLEDPRAENANAAVAGLYERYLSEGVKALRPYKARYLKMKKDPDPGVRRIAVWALAHSGDLDVVPALIESLVDPNEEVVTTAKVGLQIISRKIEGLGPPSPSTPEQRQEAAKAWSEWYRTARPLKAADDIGDSSDPGNELPSQDPAKAKGRSGQ